MFVRVPRPIHLLVHFATKQSFQAWSRGLQVLHFSGHGNDHCVYFEDNSGVAVPITPHEVAELLPTPLTLKLVFVASCASENIAFDVAKNFVASLPNTRNPDQVAHKFQLLPEGRRDLHGSAVLFPVDEVEKCLDLSDPFEWSQVSVVPMDEHLEGIEASLGLALHPDMWPNIIMFDGCDPLHHHCLLRQYVEDFVSRLLAQKNDLHIVLTVRTPLVWLHHLDGVGHVMEVRPLAMVDGAKLLQKELNRPLKLADYDLLELPIPTTPSLSSDDMAKWVATSRVFQATRGVPMHVLALVDRLKL
ncbi:hypothetical protein DYB32_004773 [Aphanomyces invadans]|uniref:CHAT domain-containing protein n=1 Tax=Aphanomyces invadans TaxID=157072 RepID=A0A418AWH4_9STRA|nr:hypothetical protein DYB32_004773 [Aphanomyces invadans]